MCQLSEIKHGAVFMMEIPHNSNIEHMQAGVRPVVAISNNMNLKSSPCIHIIPLTTSSTKHNIPTHVTVNANFLKQKSMCLVEQLMQVSKQALIETGRYLGSLSEEDLTNVKDAIKIQLALAWFIHKVNLLNGGLFFCNFFYF